MNFSLNEKQIAAAKRLLLTIDVINETVGDAISDMFLAEVVLQTNGWDVKDWYNTYDDLPNLQKKVSVSDRNAITTTDAERVCVTPAGLQDEIDKVVAKYPRGRSFVRPSGTEDVVRVYAEAARKEVRPTITTNSGLNLIFSKISSRLQDTESLAAEVAALVHKLAGGIGPVPQLPNNHAHQNGVAEQ